MRRLMLAGLGLVILSQLGFLAHYLGRPSQLLHPEAAEAAAADARAATRDGSTIESLVRIVHHLEHTLDKEQTQALRWRTVSGRLAGQLKAATAELRVRRGEEDAAGLRRAGNNRLSLAAGQAGAQTARPPVPRTPPLPFSPEPNHVPAIPSPVPGTRPPQQPYREVRVAVVQSARRWVLPGPLSQKTQLVVNTTWAAASMHGAEDGAYADTDAGDAGMAGGGTAGGAAPGNDDSMFFRLQLICDDGAAALYLEHRKNGHLVVNARSAAGQYGRERYVYLNAPPARSLEVWEVGDTSATAAAATSTTAGNARLRGGFAVSVDGREVLRAPYWMIAPGNSEGSGATVAQIIVDSGRGVRIQGASIVPITRRGGPSASTSRSRKGADPAGDAALDDAALIARAANAQRRARRGPRVLARSIVGTAAATVASLYGGDRPENAGRFLCDLVNAALSTMVVRRLGDDQYEVKGGGEGGTASGKSGGSSSSSSSSSSELVRTTAGALVQLRAFFDSDSSQVGYGFAWKKSGDGRDGGKDGGGGGGTAASAASALPTAVHKFVEDTFGRGVLAKPDAIDAGVGSEMRVPPRVLYRVVLNAIGDAIGLPGSPPTIMRDGDDGGDAGAGDDGAGDARQASVCEHIRPVTGDTRQFPGQPPTAHPVHDVTAFLFHRSVPTTQSTATSPSTSTASSSSSASSFSSSPSSSSPTTSAEFSSITASVQTVPASVPLVVVLHSGITGGNAGGSNAHSTAELQRLQKALTNLRTQGRRNVTLLHCSPPHNAPGRRRWQGQGRVLRQLTADTHAQISLLAALDAVHTKYVFMMDARTQIEDTEGSPPTSMLNALKFNIERQRTKASLRPTPVTRNAGTQPRKDGTTGAGTSSTTKSSAFSAPDSWALDQKCWRLESSAVRATYLGGRFKELSKYQTCKQRRYKREGRVASSYLKSLPPSPIVAAAPMSHSNGLYDALCFQMIPACRAGAPPRRVQAIHNAKVRRQPTIPNSSSS